MTESQQDLSKKLEAVTNPIEPRTVKGQFPSPFPSPFLSLLIWIKHFIKFFYVIGENDTLFRKQITMIKTFSSWNGFPKSVPPSLRLTKRFKCSLSKLRTPNPDESNAIWLRLPYAGSVGESIVNRLASKLKPAILRSLFSLKFSNQTRKLSFVRTKISRNL